MNKAQEKYRRDAQRFTNSWVNGILIFLLLFTVCFYIVEQRYDLQKSEEMQATINIAESVKSRLQQSLQYSLSATQALTLTIDKDGVPRNFDSVASFLLHNNKYIDALQLVPGGTIRYIYPLKGNEAALGYNILADTTRNKEALRAIEKRELFFAGPLNFKQGGIGIVGRLPVFLNDQFWGFSAAVIHMPTLLSAGGLDTTGKSGYYYQLSKINPNTNTEESFLPYRTNFGSKSVVTIAMPIGDWKLTASPVNANKAFESIIPISILGLTLSVMGGLFAAYLTRTRRLALRESEVRLKTILDTDPECIKLMNPEMIPIEINSPGLEMLEAESFDQLKNRSLLEVVTEKYRESAVSLVRSAFEGHSGKLEFEMQTLKGNRRWCEILVVPFRNADGDIIAALGVTRDMTLWKIAEEKLKKSLEEIRRLTDHIQTVREEERRRVSREIHDELGQELTVLKINISRLGARIREKNELHSPALKEIADTINNIVTTVRKISSDLRPGLLDDLGLAAAIEWYSNDFSKRTGINVKFFSALQEGKLPEKVNVGLFRLYQESLGNIVSHSSAEKVNVSLSEQDHQLVLLIEDDGKGFDSAALKERETFGILSMTERAIMIGGTYNVFSHPNKGTVIEIVVPMNPSELLRSED